MDEIRPEDAASGPVATAAVDPQDADAPDETPNAESGSLGFDGGVEDEPAAEPDEELEPAPAEPEPEAAPEPETAPAEPEPEAAPEPETAPAEARPEHHAPAAAAPAAVPAPVPSAPAQPGPRTVGRLIADTLRAVGVRYAFTVPGESFLGLLDGLDGAGIRVVAARHEGGAAFMAEAYGQLTGRPAVCLGTRAVGAANLAIGIHTARQDSTPMFALIGQVERAFLGREAFQEVDQVNSFGRLAKWSAEVRDVGDVVGALGRAVREALVGRPGPVLLSLPEDLLDQVVPTGVGVDVGRPTPLHADLAEIRAVLQLLASAERPVILAGGGVLKARTSSDLTRLAEMLHVPVVAAWRRGDVFPNDHPLYLGMAGYFAAPTVRERLERADAMLVIGCRLNEPTSFGYRIPSPGTPWAHVDLAPRAAEHGEVAVGLPPPTIAVRADARAFVRAAVQRLQAGVLDAKRLATRRRAVAEDRAAWEAASVVDDGEWSGPGVHPGRTIATLRAVLPDQGIVTTDAGNFGGWAARGFRFRRPGTFLGPTSGAMGYALPAAIAAALVHRDRPVVALAGDGGLAMTMAELETAVRERTRVVVLVFDNERYGTIRMHQDRRPDGARSATDLGPIDFAAVARACGARGVRVERDEEFEPSLRQALAADRPTVLHLMLDRRWVSVDEPANA